MVRSGARGLGEWQSERRRVQADYRTAIGEPPQRIVAVWLIANSVFQHGKGIAAFADHTLFIAPYRSAHDVNDAAPAIVAPSPSRAFAVPDNLRTNAGEVPEHVNAF